MGRRSWCPGTRSVPRSSPTSAHRRPYHFPSAGAGRKAENHGKIKISTRAALRRIQQRVAFLRPQEPCSSPRLLVMFRPLCRVAGYPGWRLPLRPAARKPPRDSGSAWPPNDVSVGHRTFCRCRGFGGRRCSSGCRCADAVRSRSSIGPSRARHQRRRAASMRWSFLSASSSARNASIASATVLPLPAAYVPSRICELHAPRPILGCRQLGEAAVGGRMAFEPNLYAVAGTLRAFARLDACLWRPYPQHWCPGAAEPGAVTADIVGLPAVAGAEPMSTVPSCPKSRSPTPRL